MSGLSLSMDYLVVYCQVMCIGGVNGDQSY